jgi:hypothetical protein
MVRGNQTINEMFLSVTGVPGSTTNAPKTAQVEIGKTILAVEPTAPEITTNPAIEVAASIETPTRTVGDPIRSVAQTQTVEAPTTATPTAEEEAKAKRAKMIKTAVVVIIVLAVAYYFYKKKNG